MNRDKLFGGSAERVDLDGAKVLRVINRKDEIGRVPLGDILPVADSVYSSISNANFNFMPIGSSLFGTHIKVPKEYMERREVSRIIDILVKGVSVEISAVMEKCGWRRINDPKEYFSMEVQLSNKEISLIGTMTDQTLFTNNEGFVLSSIGVPSTFYQKDKYDGLKSVRFEEIPTISLSVAHKLLRGTKQDISDLVAIFTSNRVKDIIGEEGDVTINTIMREKAASSVGWGIEFSRKIGKIASRLAEIGKNHGIDPDSLEWFEKTGKVIDNFTASFKEVKR